MLVSDDVAQQACHCRHSERGDAPHATYAYQSVWMARWKQACRSRIGVAIDVCTNAAAFTEPTSATRVSFMDEANPEKSKRASFVSKSFPIFSLSPKAGGSGDDNISLSRTKTDLPSTSAHLPPKTKSLFSECQLLSEGVLPADLLMKTPDAVEENNLAVSASLRNDCVKSNSDIVPYGHEKGKSSMTSFAHGQHQKYQSNFNLASKGQGQSFTSTRYRSYYSPLFREKKMSGLVDPRRSSFSKWMQSDDELDFVHGQLQKLQNYAANAMITNQTGSLKSTNAQNFTKFKGNAFSEILDFSSLASVYALEVAEIEEMENVHYLRTPTNLKNESSAETNTMDIDALQEKHLLGNVPFPTNKCFKDSQNLFTSQVAITSAEEKTKAKLVDTALPDINQVPSELPKLESPGVDRETSTSRAHSFDLECHLSYADEHAKSKSSTSGNCSLGPEPSCRWVKRLKLCKSGSAHGVNSAKIVETSSREKVRKTFSKIMKCSKTSSEPKMICHAEEQLVPDLPATILTNGKSSFAKPKQTVDITLSHVWIQRWSHNRAASSQKRHDLVELCEPKSSNTVPDEFQKKQFPSIAAMALMGKAMSSLNPYELMKKGPLVVWNGV